MEEGIWNGQRNWTSYTLRYHVLFISSSIAEYMNKGNEISKLNHTVITIYLASVTHVPGISEFVY